MPEMTITFKQAGEPDAVIIVPALTVEATDKVAQSVGKKNTLHLVARYLLDNLLVGVVLPRTPLPEHAQENISALEAELAAKKAQLEAARLAEFLPALFIGGQEVTLPQIEARLKENNEN